MSDLSRFRIGGIYPRWVSLFPPFARPRSKQVWPRADSFER